MCSFSTWRHLGKRHEGMGHWTGQVVSQSTARPRSGPAAGLVVVRVAWEKTSTPRESERGRSLAGSQLASYYSDKRWPEVGANSSCHQEERPLESSQILPLGFPLGGPVTMVAGAWEWGGRSSRGQVLSARCSLPRYMAVPSKEWLPTVFRKELGGFFLRQEKQLGIRLPFSPIA